MTAVKWTRGLVVALLIGCGWACGAADDAMDVDAGAKDAAAPATPCTPDETAPVPSDRCSIGGSDTSLPACEAWTKIELPNTQCGNGSQYKFFVNYSSKSNNIVLMFEGGGACWDYASCTGGARGAANVDGIPDNHMDLAQYINLIRRDDTNPLQDWNMIFVSYCTGDVHTGSKVATYDDPDGGMPLDFHHVGHDNTSAVVEWINGHFDDVPQLLVTGYSAGGIGALQNYYYIREGISGLQCGYLLNDSGPAFHSDGPSKQVQETTRKAWGVDPLLDELEGKLPVSIAALKKDAALLNTAIADKYPSDRLSMTVYEMDLNYSLYSYERFYPGIDEAMVHQMWSEELAALLDTYDTRDNLSYYVPYFRHDNCSHCVSIPPIAHDNNTIMSTPWLGTEIEQDGLDLRDYVDMVMDDTRPLKSYHEDPQPDEMFTPEESMMCMTP